MFFQFEEGGEKQMDRTQHHATGRQGTNRQPPRRHTNHNNAQRAELSPSLQRLIDFWAAYAPCKLDVPNHESHALAVDCTQVAAHRTDTHESQS